MPPENHTFTTFPIASGGFCKRCNRGHLIDSGSALPYGRFLLDQLEKNKRLDLDIADDQSDFRFTLAPLYGPSRGQMFGVLICRRQDGVSGMLKAFSGQFNGVWEAPGWVPPLLDVALFQRISDPVDQMIKKLGKEIEGLETDSPQRQELTNHRRELSRNLMREIHDLYAVTNFRGETEKLSQIYRGSGGMPTGTGDCCAPKLLNHAARHQLIPLGLTEFYLGRENRSSTRHHGRFYPACSEKCQPIMGFMLCGLDREHG
ncbi:MAG: hypothetical protein KJ950_15285 [Proteobacteria bacterium]|nr:hypothetical protein [Pseudomonadota bacterium]MBU1686888.1 hypothetical protein [Pseudomonadota bacterium]